METGHTLILGWSEKGLAVLQQIALANKSEGGLPIVVLCSESKEEMEDIVRAASQRTEDQLALHGSRVVFRTGNPINEHDLVIACSLSNRLGPPRCLAFRFQKLPFCLICYLLLRFDPWLCFLRSEMDISLPVVFPVLLILVIISYESSAS